jgi:peptidoglycan-associated lipoprotein
MAVAANEWTTQTKGGVMTMHQFLPICGALLGFTVACSPEQSPKVAEPPMTPAAASLQPRVAPPHEKVNVYVNRDVLELCSLPVPHFSFDSSALSERASDGLDELAECFTTGAAAGKRLRLVGHADPRGTYEYNLALGERRAARVADFLKSQGVASNRIETSSRGEMDATGTEETSWAQDRRVGIFLAE